MSVLVWLIAPLLAVLVAIVWTAALARRERRRLDERWRAQRLAERGAQVLGPPPATRTGASQPSAGTDQR